MNRAQFQVQYLMMKNTKEMITSLLLFVAALFLTAIAPSLLLRYVYAGQQLLAEPKLLEYIPLVSSLVASLYFIYAVVGCIIRSNKIKHLMNEVEMMSDLDIDSELSEVEIAELESIVDEAITKKKPAIKAGRKAGVKTASKKVAKKTTKRKTEK